MFGLFKKSNGPIAPDKLRYTPLRFDLSGNILELAIPDNVRPDMPAIELINVTDFMNSRYTPSEVLGTEGAVINSGTINAALGANVML